MANAWWYTLCLLGGFFFLFFALHRMKMDIGLAVCISRNVYKAIANFPIFRPKSLEVFVIIHCCACDIHCLPFCGFAVEKREKQITSSAESWQRSDAKNSGCALPFVQFHLIVIVFVVSCFSVWCAAAIHFYYCCDLVALLCVSSIRIRWCCETRNSINWFDLLPFLAHLAQKPKNLIIDRWEKDDIESTPMQIISNSVCFHFFGSFFPFSCRHIVVCAMEQANARRQKNNKQIKFVPLPPRKIKVVS